MKLVKYLFYVLISTLFLFPVIIEAQTWNVNPDFWMATDNLGRTTPTEQEAGNILECFIGHGTQMGMPIFLRL